MKGLPENEDGTFSQQNQTNQWSGMRKGAALPATATSTAVTL
jgi:hypothetical protein